VAFFEPSKKAIWPGSGPKLIFPLQNLQFFLFKNLLFAKAKIDGKLSRGVLLGLHFLYFGLLAFISLSFSFCGLSFLSFWFLWLQFLLFWPFAASVPFIFAF